MPRILPTLARRSQLRFARVAGVPVSLELISASLLVAYVAFQAVRGGDWPRTLTLAGMATVLLVAHEAGHAVAGRLVRLPVAGITLSPVFGYCRYRRQPRGWRHEALTAAGGPLVHAALAPVLLAALYLARAAAGGSGDTVAARLLTQAGAVNAALLGFNLLPFWPLDGARILAALLEPVVGYTRSRFVVSILGMVGGALLMMVAYRHFNLILLTLSFWFFHAGGTTLDRARHLRVFERRRHPSNTATCPWCRRQARASYLVECAECETPRFYVDAPCYACHSPHARLTCQYCDVRFPLFTAAAPPATPTTPAGPLHAPVDQNPLTSPASS